MSDGRPCGRPLFCLRYLGFGISDLGLGWHSGTLEPGNIPTAGVEADLCVRPWLIRAFTGAVSE